jgi:hypothetical protein
MIFAEPIMKKSVSLTLALGSLALSPLASQAAELYLYSPPSFDIMNNKACVAEGDFVSCSTTFLNYLAGIGGPQYQTTTPTGYVIDSNQGALKSMVVVGTGAGGQIPNNLDFSTQIDRGYDIPNNGNFETSTAADPAQGPTGPAPYVWDSPKAWDISLQSLADALTIGGTRHNALIGYDFNETGGVGQSTMIWALVTVRDADGTLAPINYELTLRNGLGPASSVYGFNTPYSFDGVNPTAINPYTDMTYIAGDICVAADGTFIPLIGTTTCPAGYTHLSNNLGTSKAEWISYIPELDEGLEGYIADGYDVLSVQVKIGCFTTSGPFAESCNDGGYDDIFIMAGDVRPPQQDVPEPATLPLLGAALLAAGAVSRRHART